MNNGARFDNQLTWPDHDIWEELVRRSAITYERVVADFFFELQSAEKSNSRYV